jgi:molybdopterin molybdotransferase
MTTELSITQAVAHLVARLAPLRATEHLTLAQATGRVLAADVVSPLDLPSFDNAAMDGYAVRAADLGAGTPLREIGRALAGHPFASEVTPGTCVRIMTGAALPSGADTVVMIEDVAVAGGSVALQRTPPPGANIRRRGEHVRQGEVVLAVGRRLRAVDVALAAAVGTSQLEVIRQLRVAVASTGDELADPPQALAPSGAYDANRPFLMAGLERLGCAALDLGICADTDAAFEDLLTRACAADADALVMSGGAAQGDADVVRRAGGIEFLPLVIRPGRGIAFATLARADKQLALFGLPGNAVAAFVMFHLVARPALLHLAGSAARIVEHLPLPLACDVRTRGGRIEYRRARLLIEDQHVAVMPLKEQGSAMLRTVAEADVLLALGPRAEYQAGELVPVVLLSSLD